MVFSMNQTTKNAPFGTDDTPSMRMKILGGKRVQIAVSDSKQSSRNTRDLPQNFLSPPPGPHGTPSILHQPDWEAYDSGELRSGHTRSKQPLVTRKVTSYTSPAGDRSYSFKHGLPSFSTKAVLPPIATQPVNGVYANPYHLSVHNELRSSVTLDEEVGSTLKDFSTQKLKDMYIDLTTFDRKLTGMVSDSQFSLVALRHALPLKLSLLKVLFAKFIDTRDPTMINYERVLQFLSDCAANATQTATTQIKTDLIPEDRVEEPSYTTSKKNEETGRRSELSPRRHEPQKSIIPSSDQYASPLRKEEEDKLVGLILGQLAPSEKMDVEGLKVSLQELDRLRSGHLPIHVISSACIRHRIPLTDSLIAKMLHRAETSNGVASWTRFLEPLERVQSMRGVPTSAGEVDEKATASPRSWLPAYQAKPASVHTSSSARGTGTSTPAVLPWERRPLGDIGGKDTLTPKVPYSPVSTASSEAQDGVRLPDGWDEREPLDRVDMYGQPKYSEPWPQKFNKLAHALHTYHPHNKEVLPKEEAERVTKNYNLIYALGFSDEGIESAVRQSVLPQTSGSLNMRVSVDKLLDILEGKRALA